MRQRKLLHGALVAACVLNAPGAVAQESSSRANSETAMSAPTAALRDVLSAACAQNEKEFARFLTARNGEAFARMTPSARVALMRRFVLLEKTGTASVIVNAPGRPTVRCKTATGAVDVQIGGADEQDNVALMPVAVRETSDETGVSAIQTKMGLVRENGEWKLLSVGLLLLDLPALEVQWDAAEAKGNEDAAVAAMRKLAEAVELYRRTYARLPEGLANLGPSADGKASGESAGLLDAELASGRKDGYAFRYVIVGASDLGAPAKYELSATPQTYGRTGLRSFYRDSAGTLRSADHKGAVGNQTDPKIE